MAMLWIILSLFVWIQSVTGTLTNIALNKPVNISSTLGRNELPPGGAVDGVITTTYDTGIIHTAQKRNSSWWTVDLQTQVQDATVKIYFRTEHTYRRNGVQLYTSTTPFSNYPSGQLCLTFNGSNIPDVGSATCTGRWRYLMVYTNTNNRNEGAILQFGEVQVWVCSAGTYGKNCDKSCSSRQCAVATASCDRYTGACPAGGCRAGRRGTDCTQVCSDGTYGTNCDKSCSSRHCAVTPTSCDRYTGACPAGGCKTGWRGADCTQVCPSGTYGAGCASTCGNCMGDYACHHVTGNCHGACRPGWRGSQCKQTCANHYYGQNCSSLCDDRNCIRNSSCHHVTGSCDKGCKAGWEGTVCRQLCDREHYGPDCNGMCITRHCEGSSTCNLTTGQCDQGCQTGWDGIDCTQKSENLSAMDHTVVIAVSVTAVVVVILILVTVGFIVWRRTIRRKKKRAEHTYYNTASDNVKVKDEGSEVSHGDLLPSDHYDSADIPRDTGSTYTTIDDVDKHAGDPVGVANTRDDYEPVSDRKYEILNPTSRAQENSYTGFERSYENVK